MSGSSFAFGQNYRGTYKIRDFIQTQVSESSSLIYLSLHSKCHCVIIITIAVQLIQLEFLHLIVLILTGG